MSRFACDIRRLNWRPSLQAKVIVAAVACLTVRFALAQAPPVGGGTSATVGADESGYKILLPSKFLSENKSKQLEVRNNVRRILSAPENTIKDNSVMFDSYYTRFNFPTMTQTTPEALKALPEERNRFFRTEVEPCKNAEVHAHLVGLTFDQMSAIVQDTFHPAVRYNAMLIISTLNDQEVVRYGGETKVPEPMARALPFILAEFKNPANSDAIKVAALIGLARHLEWDPHRAVGSVSIPPATRTEIINELLALAQAKNPPLGRNAEGHLWLRRRAVEALGLACYSKLESPVADALDQLLREESEPLELRFAVATAVGRLNYQAPAKIDTVSTVKELGYLALLACDSELNRLKNLKQTEEDQAARVRGEARSGSAGGGESGFDDPMGASGPMPGSGGGSPPGVGGAGFGGGQGNAVLLADPKAYRFDLARRRIRSQLYCIQFGLTGGEDFIPGRPPIAPTPGAMPPRGMNAYAKPGDEKKYVSDVYASVRKLADIVENKAVDVASLDKDLRKSMKSLEAITKKLAVPVAPAAEEADADAPVVPAAAKPPAAEAAPAVGPMAASAPAAAPAAAGGPAAAP